MSVIVLCISTGLKRKSDGQVMDAKSTHTLTHHFQNTASNPKPCELPGLRPRVCKQSRFKEVKNGLNDCVKRGKSLSSLQSTARLLMPGPEERRTAVKLWPPH